MAWDRVECPYCGRDVAVSPVEHRMRDHRSVGHYCRGSNRTVREAELDMLSLDDLCATIRTGLHADASRLERDEAFQALDDLGEKWDPEPEPGW